MSDLIKRARDAEIGNRALSMVGNADLIKELADALENPMHAALMVAAERCEIERAGYELHPKADTSRTGENAYIVGYQDGCADCRDGIEKLASEYPPSVCVPVETVPVPIDTLVLLRRAITDETPAGKAAIEAYEKLKNERRAMLTAARKP